LIVTVLVITYNSESTIIQTLESIKDQSYGSTKIELIISDDFSNDKTIEIAQNWLNINSKLFNNSIIIKSDSNNGVSANVNSGLNLATSKWFKLIAGDDLLTVGCIYEFVEYVTLNPEVKAVFSLVKCFGGNEGEIFPSSWYHEIFYYDQERQYMELLKGNYIAAPSQFLCVKTVLSTGGFCEEFTLFEDYPMWLLLSNIGVKFCLLPEPLVLYRVSNSISHSRSKMFNINMVNQKRRFVKTILIPSIPQSLFRNLIVIDKNIEYFSEMLVIKLFSNKRNNLNKFLVLLISMFRPFYLERKFKYFLYRIGI
jgi:glycosyltransferase involved in cell wall biosynthesis